MKFTQTAQLHTALGAHVLRLRTARNLWNRFWGLMFAAPLQADPQPQGLLITRCPSVHGFFMRQSLDLAYLAADAGGDASTASYIVTHVCHLKPWRISVGKSHALVTQQGVRTLRAAHVLELPLGSAQRLGIMPGDKLELMV